MTPTHKRFLSGALVGAGLFGAIVLAVELPDHLRSASHARSSAVAAKAEQRTIVSNAQSSFATQVAQSSPEVIEPMAPLPADAVSIPDSYLLGLSSMVDLPNARDRRPDLNRWKHAIPVAEKLLEGPCDCEQRNWLTHFVEMGNSALTNAQSDYSDNATLMASLGRNDAQAMALRERTK